jgi:hypothetical protein
MTGITTGETAVQKFKFFVRDSEVSFILLHSDTTEAVVKYNSNLYDLVIMSEENARLYFWADNIPLFNTQEKIDAFEELLASVKEELQ